MVHLPLDIKCYYLTEDLRIERIGLNLYRQPNDSPAPSYRGR